MSTVLDSDYLIIGSGIAGLSFAIRAAETGTVNIVTKKKESESSTNRAQGGIASVLDPSDSFDNHIQDTLKAGAYLNDIKSVELLVHEGPSAIAELLDWGARFSMEYNARGEKVLSLGKEGGHSHNRIVHSADLTGQTVEKALLARIASMPNVKIHEDHTAIDLLTEHQLGTEPEDGRPTCYGAYILNNSSGEVITFRAKVTLLASGGVGQVYLHTTNPEIATGDGIAMAYLSGAAIADMEFIQFHPTSFYSKKDVDGPAFLISEAVRGEGAVLLNSRGKRFMEGIHPLADLAPRDVVARAIDRELKASGEESVFLDITHRDREYLQNRFPQIFVHCLDEGIDMSRDPIPVVPAAHYLCGGVVTDLNGRTAIKRLYAAGESACTGVHGANRLASNSLLEAVVFSNRAFVDAVETVKRISGSRTPEFPSWDKEGTFDLDEWILVQHNMEHIKRLMWDFVGIVRCDTRLEMAARRMRILTDEIHEVYRKSTLSSRMIELRNLATIAELIITGAMARSDSIGLHYNTDHPESSAEPVNVILRNGLLPELRRLDHRA